MSPRGVKLCHLREKLQVFHQKLVRPLLESTRRTSYRPKNHFQRGCPKLRKVARRSHGGHHESNYCQTWSGDKQTLSNAQDTTCEGGTWKRFQRNRGGAELPSSDTYSICRSNLFIGRLVYRLTVSLPVAAN